MKTRMGNVMLGAMLGILLTAGIGHADLVGYWSFDNAADPGHDDSDNGHHGTVVGAISTPGMVSNALSFDGIDDYVQVAQNAETILASGHACTVALWMNMASLPGISQRTVGCERVNDGFAVDLNGAGLEIFASTGIEPHYSTPITIQEGVWYHVAMTFQEDHTWDLFVDGELRATMIQDWNYFTGDRPLIIGADSGDYETPTAIKTFAHAKIDEVRIYNRALSADEIRQLTNSPPVVTITNPSSGFLAPVNTPVTFAGLIDDPDIGDTHAAIWTMTSESVSENRNGTVLGGSVNNSFQFSQAGIYSISLTVADAAGESDTATTVNGLPAFIVVYDPSAGFVTGGGWIYSPAYALLDSPAAGKASFGFVAKYKQGATTPQGNTEFQFQAGDFRFKSSSYEWLVIAGSKAMFKGEGYIDGMGGGFKFMLTAVDGPEDRFRIKIWNPISDDVIYDNKRGESDDAEPTVIGGGSIVIHKK